MSAESGGKTAGAAAAARVMGRVTSRATEFKSVAAAAEADERMVGEIASRMADMTASCKYIRKHPNAYQENEYAVWQGEREVAREMDPRKMPAIIRTFAAIGPYHYFQHRTEVPVIAFIEVFPGAQSPGGVSAAAAPMGPVTAAAIAAGAMGPASAWGAANASFAAFNGLAPNEELPSI